METGDGRIQSMESNIVTNIIKGIYIYIYTNQPKVFVQSQISFHIFSHLSIYQTKYTLNEVSTK